MQENYRRGPSILRRSRLDRVGKGTASQKNDANLTWIQQNDTAYFLGTEAPGDGSLPAIGGSMATATLCSHCINYDMQGNVTKDSCGKARQENSTKAKTTSRRWEPEDGCILRRGDEPLPRHLAQFCHPMSPGARGDDEATLHSRYEESSTDQRHRRADQIRFWRPTSEKKRRRRQPL